MLVFLRTPSETFALAYRYLAVYLLGYAAVYLYCYFTAVLRSFGNSVFQMAAMLVCTVLNAFLDPNFIHRYGFGGAAAATLFSQSVCLVFMLIFLTKKRLFAFRLSAFDLLHIKPLIKKCVPSAFQQSIPAISTSFLTSLVSGYGITALAAYGITGKLETLLFYPAMALNMALTTIVGQCAGGGRYDRARDYIKCSLLYGCVLLALLSGFIVLFPRQLSGLFIDSPDASSIVARYFHIVGLGYLLNTVTNCFMGAVNGMGKSLKSMLCMVLYYIVVRMPLSWFFSYIGWGLTGIWYAVLFSHIVAAIAAAAIANAQLLKQEKSPAALPKAAPSL